jgi:hypothetical protein
VVGERPQRAGGLALVDAQPAGDVDHAQPGVVRAAGEHLEREQAAPQAAATVARRRHALNGSQCRPAVTVAA